MILHVKTDGSGEREFSYGNPGSLDGAIKAASKAKEQTTIFLHPGIYSLSKTLRFGSEMSDVEFRALSGTGVFFDGGLPVVGWHVAQVDGKKLFMANAGKVLAVNEDVRFLYINGQRKQSCRYPAAAPLKAEISDSRASCLMPDSLLHLHELGQFELVLNYDWICRRLRIKKIEKDGIDFIPEQIRKHKSANLHIENLPVEFLNPGQWTLNRNSKTIYYMPEENESLDGLEAFVGFLPVIMEINGDYEAGDYVENMIFDGIEFRHSGDASLVNSCQAECDCSAAVHLSGALNCRFENCSFCHTSGWGLALDSGCRGNTVTHCMFEDLGAGGLKANGAAQNGSPGITGQNYFTHNIFHNGGRFWSSAVAILIRHSADNLVANNEISHFQYSGISCGWVWGYAANISRDNLILYNHIHHLGEEHLLVDMGGIYTLGVQQGSVIRGNHIHDIRGDIISWGIYLDEGSSEFLVERNLVYNIRSECFHLHYGRRNVVRDNVFAFGGKEGISSVTRGTMGRDLKFTPGDIALIFSNNIMVSSGEPFIVKYMLDYQIKEDLSCIESDSNIMQSIYNELPVIVCDGFHIFDMTYQVKLGEKELRSQNRLEKNSLFVCSAEPLSSEVCRRFISPETEVLYRQLFSTNR